MEIKEIKELLKRYLRVKLISDEKRIELRILFDNEIINTTYISK